MLFSLSSVVSANIMGSIKTASLSKMALNLSGISHFRILVRCSLKLMGELLICCLAVVAEILAIESKVFAKLLCVLCPVYKKINK